MTFSHPEKIYNTRAASQVVPIIINLFAPKSVVDVGCGIGSWLKVFEFYKILDLIGIDGNHIDKDKLLIEPAKYIEMDLEKPIAINRIFDLVICLEVAEHLSDGRSANLIKELTRLSQIVVFSAAIPFQGGENHINEKYPQYWINLFKLNNFDCYDIIRPLIWNNELVDWWYRQNILVFIAKDYQSNLSATQKISPLISQELYESKLTRIQKLELELLYVQNGGMSIKFYWKNLKKVLRKRLNHLTGN